MYYRTLTVTNSMLNTFNFQSQLLIKLEDLNIFCTKS
jgi:hypothetical protein